LPLWGIALLAVSAAVAAGAFAGFFIPPELSAGVKRFIVVAAGCLTLIIGLLAIPIVRDDSGAAGSSPTPLTRQRSQAGSTQEAATPQPDEPRPTGVGSESSSGPLTASLDVDAVEDCETFAIDPSQLKNVPSHKNFNAQWAYKHGGATTTGIPITVIVQGTSDQAVVLRGLDVVDFKKLRPIDNPVTVAKCPGGRGGEEYERYFTVELNEKNPKVVARPGDAPDEKGKVQPAAKFPFKVSNSDPEVFELWAEGPPCLCSWRLALIWSSGGKSGKIVLDRGFSSMLTDTRKEGFCGGFWLQENGELSPPLPEKPSEPGNC
jgi:hypothetical protein